MTDTRKNKCLKMAWGIAHSLWWMDPSKPYQTKYGSAYVRIRGFYIRISDHRPKKNSRVKWVLYSNESFRKKRYEYGMCEVSKMITDVKEFFERNYNGKSKNNSTK